MNNLRKLAFSTPAAIVLVLLAANPVFAMARPRVPASRQATEVFAPMAMSIPQTLLQRGLTQIGSLRMEQLLREIGAVNWSLFSLGFPAGSGGKRTTAMYFVKTKQVLIGELGWNMVWPEFRDLMALHEGLGASGYDDENYQLSSSLWYLARIPVEEAQELLRASAFLDATTTVARRAKEPRYLLAMGGGGTGVGGGGDYIGAESKAMLLRLARDQFRKSHLTSAQFEALTRTMLSADFEADYSSMGQGYFVGQPSGTSSCKKRPDGTVEVKISMRAWTFYSVTRNYGGLASEVLAPIFLQLEREIGIDWRQ